MRRPPYWENGAKLVLSQLDHCDSPRSAQIAGHAGVYGFAGTTGKTPSSSGPVVGQPQHCARGLGAGPTVSQFPSGFCQRWPSGHLQQSYKVFPSPPRKRSRPDTEHGVDDGHGASTTHVCSVGRTTGRLVYDIRQQTTHQVCIAVSGPQG